MAKRSSIVAAIIAVLVAALAAVSCSSSKDGPGSGHGAVTFTGSIQQLVEQKCVTCHREGGMAPFPLATYEDLKTFGALAKEKVTQREMPPWGAFDDESCTVSRDYKNDLSMSQDQIDMFAAWVDDGMPPGDGPVRVAATTDAPPAGLAGKTDTFEAATSHMVEGGANDEIRCFPVDPKLDADTWVEESLVVPEDQKVVHHALVYIDAKREGFAKAGRAGSYPCFGGPEIEEQTLLLAWSPGGTSTTYGENAAVKLPKGTHLLVQVHYHPLAKTTTGRVNLELKASKQAPQRVAGFVLGGNAEDSKNNAARLLPGPDDPSEGPRFLIPSNAKGHTETMELRIPPSIAETRLAAVGAHMHWAGVGLKLEIDRRAPADGEPASECLLGVPKYDFSWQRTYSYDAPIEQLPIIRGGDTLRITCTYDNTRDNRNLARALNERRISTPPAIRLGGDSLDEMCQAILVFVD